MIADNWADVMWKICTSSSVCAPLSLPVLSLRSCLHSVRYHKGHLQQTCQHSNWGSHCDLTLPFTLPKARLSSHFCPRLLLAQGGSLAQVRKQWMLEADRHGAIAVLLVCLNRSPTLGNVHFLSNIFPLSSSCAECGISTCFWTKTESLTHC